MWKKITKTQSDLRRAQSDSHFQILQDGTKTFYPQGSLGRQGYYVSSPELETRLRKRLHQYYRLWDRIDSALCINVGILLPLMILAIINVWGVILLASLGEFLGWLHARLYFAKYTKEMGPSHIANSPIAHWSEWGKKVHPARLFSYMLFPLIFIGGGLCLYIVTNEPKMLICSAFFALRLVPYGIATYSKCFA